MLHMHLAVSQQASHKLLHALLSEFIQTPSSSFMLVHMHATPAADSGTAATVWQM